MNTESSLSIGTEMLEQTMQIQIRLLLKENSDEGDGLNFFAIPSASFRHITAKCFIFIIIRTMLVMFFGCSEL